MDKVFEKLLNMIQDEQQLINELLVIDNNINGTNITIGDLYNSLKQVLEMNNKFSISQDTIFITEGSPLITITILKNIINYFDYKYILYINEGFIGINEWLINRFKNIVGNEIDITLDTDINYNKYIKNNNFKVIPIGEKEFVSAVYNDFK